MQKIGVQFLEATDNWGDKMNYLKNKQYNFIDLLRFIMAFFVIYIHKPFLMDSYPLINMIITQMFARCAVPFYLAAAGFLFFGRAQSGQKTPSREYLLRYIKRLLIMYCIWSVLYFPTKLYSCIVQHESIPEMLLDYLKHIFLHGTHIHLWFLPALAIAICLTYLFLTKLSIKATLVISILINLAYKAFVFSTHNEKGEDYFLILSVCFCFAFVAIGAYVAQNKGFSKKANYFGLGISFLLVVITEIIRFKAESTFLKEKNIFMFGIIYFLLSIAKEIELKPRLCYLYLRKSSSLIYLSHLLVGERMLYTLAYLIGQEQLGYNPLFKFLFVLLYTLPLSFGLIWLEEKKHFGIIKRLH